MSELPSIVPRPVSIAKVGRCAEGLSVKPMLGGTWRLQLAQLIKRGDSPKVILPANDYCRRHGCREQQRWENRGGKNEAKQKKTKYSGEACRKHHEQEAEWPEDSFSITNRKNRQFHFQFRSIEKSLRREIRFRRQNIGKNLVPPNERFSQHRPERSGRRLNCGNCTNAMARCQRAKVCPQGLSVNTMLCDVDGPSVAVFS